MNDGCIIFIIVMILIVSVVLLLSSNYGARLISNYSTQKKLTQEQENLIETLVKEGYVKINCTRCQASIDSFVWSESDTSRRQHMAVALAAYVYKKNHSHKQVYFIDIFEKQSGKKLANWKSDSGYKQFSP